VTVYFNKSLPLGALLSKVSWPVRATSENEKGKSYADRARALSVEPQTHAGRCGRPMTPGVEDLTDEEFGGINKERRDKAVYLWWTNPVSKVVRLTQDEPPIGATKARETR